MADIFAAADIEHTDEMLAAFHQWWEPHTYTDPDAADLLRGLRERGLKIGVLSNTVWPRAEHERIFERDGVLDLIDAAVYTSEITWTKPHPEAFHAALDAVGVDRPDARRLRRRPPVRRHPRRRAGRDAHDPDPAQRDPGRAARTGHRRARRRSCERLADVLGVVDGWR